MTLQSSVQAPAVTQSSSEEPVTPQSQPLTQGHLVTVDNWMMLTLRIVDSKSPETRIVMSLMTVTWAETPVGRLQRSETRTAPALATQCSVVSFCGRSSSDHKYRATFQTVEDHCHFKETSRQINQYLLKNNCWVLTSLLTSWIYMSPYTRLWLDPEFPSN